MSKKEEEPPPLMHSKKILTQYKDVKDFIKPDDYKKVTELYPFVATDYYMSLAEHSANDPIMRQLCPSIEELAETGKIYEDPLAEEYHSKVPGLVHRYPDRVLLILTNACFLNCRHCTRKRLWQKERYVKNVAAVDKMIAYLRQNPAIRDVILSGGDPLTLPDERLERILTKLRKLPQIEIIRIGTRTPVVAPWRITSKLLKILKKHRPIWLNTQFNHVREITPESAAAVRQITEAGIPVGNQAVLLKGVNDSAEAITKLCQGLLKISVRPYYLYHCDPVKGAAHFRTTITKGIEIIEKMRGHTSGLAVPTYVVDAVGGKGKIPLQPDYMLSNESGVITLRNYKNERIVYHDNPQE